MNGQECDYDVYGYISYPSIMELPEDDDSDDNIDTTYGDNAQDGGNTRKFVRHTPQQIQELENFFKECPHPSEKQKSELGRRLNLETKQIRFWFQNKRTQAKAQEERHENKILRQEHNILRHEQEQLKNSLMLCSCIICGGKTYFGGVDCVVQQLKDENARLKQERDLAKSLLTSPIQMPVSPYATQPSSSFMIPNPGRNTPHEQDSMMNDKSSFLDPSMVQPSSTSLISNIGIHAPPELDSNMNEISKFLLSPSEAHSSSSLMSCNPEGNTPHQLDSMMDELSKLLASPSVAQPSSSLINSNPGRSAPYELDSMMDELSTLLVSPSVVQSSSSLMVSNPEGNTLPELESIMNERSTVLASTSTVQPSSSVVISNQERNTPHQLDTMMDELSKFLASPSVAQPSSSLINSNPGRNAPYEVDSMMDELSTLLVRPSVVQSSSSLMVSNPEGNTLPELESIMNERSAVFGSSSTVQPSSSLLVSNQERNAPIMNETSTLLVSPSSSLTIANLERNASLELNSGGETSTISKKSLLELATVAMNELIMLGQTNSSFWKIDSISKRETLNYEEYKSFFINGLVKPPGYVMEASRETGLVLMDSLALVKTLTTNKWINMFAPIVSAASTHRLIPIGGGGPRNGSLKLIEAEFQVISPLVPKRQVKFLRYCKMLREGLWVIVDFTPRQENLNLMSDGGSNRLPSGLIIEDMTNGHSKVTWIEQAEYEKSKIPELYQLLIGSGIGLGAKRWLTTLQRHCENLSTLSTINLAGVYQGLSSNVATEIVKLAQRMNLSYYSGIIGSSARRWKRTHGENEGHNMRLVSRKNVHVRGEPTGIALSAATSVWFPVNQKTMFDFLINKSFRGQWDLLINDASIEETIKIQKSRSHESYVSLLQFVKQDYRVAVLQETWNDASGALLVYSPLDTDSLEEIMRGTTSDYVQILPSGFSILPDGGETEQDKYGGGCLLTIGYQILVNSKPFADVDQDSIKTVEELMALTIGKIKSALSIQT